jgi:hypothetical protein
MARGNYLRESIRLEGAEIPLEKVKFALGISIGRWRAEESGQSEGQRRLIVVAEFSMTAGSTHPTESKCYLVAIAVRT